MAEFLLTLAAEGILTKVTSLADQEFSLLLGFKGDLAQLRDSFLKIQALLRDVNHSQVRGEAVEMWVKDLEDIAHEADDLLDEIGYEDLRRKVDLRDRMKKRVKNFFSHSNPIVFRSQMARKIKKINTSLVKLSNQAAGPVGLVARTSADATSQDIEALDRETVSSFDSDEQLIIGREEVVSEMVNNLLKPHYIEENDLPVLAIVGMPGLGKTTLAKSIYHDSKIDSHFHEKIWVCVSTPFEVKAILRGILETLKPEKAAIQSEDAICKFIREELKGKRYLLVLDDVWSEDPEKWMKLRSRLLTINDTQGSSIIVTTRSDGVAKVMETLPRCDIRKLSDDECWLIMKEKALPVGSPPISKEQETIGREIAKRCGGVPLVSKIQGFMGVKYPSWLLLAHNLKEIEFLDCNKCEGLPVLGHLPNLSCLKINGMENLTRIGSEFYGDDHVKWEEARPLFPALRSLHIERAQNLIEWMEAPTERASVVFPCLEELTLITCGKLTSAPSHFPSLKKLVVECMDSGGLAVASILSNKLSTLTYLSLMEVGGLTCLPEGMLENNKNLAHLEITQCSDLTCISPQSKGFEYCCSSLSYLRLYFCPNLRCLPDGLLTPSLKEMKLYACDKLEYIPDATLGGLTSLETLSLSMCYKIDSIPFSQGLPSLRNLLIARCPELSSLPGGLEYSTSLRSLSIAACPKVPSVSIGSLSASLEHWCVSNVDSLPVSRGGFTSLGALKILLCESAKIGPEFSAFLETLVSLQILTFMCCESLESIPSLDKLTSLRSLVIMRCYKLTSLPKGLAASSQPCSLTRLKELSIGGFCDELDAFPAFQAIPQLESLSLEGWPKLKSLPEQTQQLPCLRHLSIDSFDGVEAIPEWLGNLASLEDLSVWGCPN